MPRGWTGARECFGKHFPSPFPRSGPQPERLVKSHHQQEEETHFTTHSAYRQTPPPAPPAPPAPSPASPHPSSPWPADCLHTAFTLGYSIVNAHHLHFRVSINNVSITVLLNHIYVDWN